LSDERGEGSDDKPKKESGLGWQLPVRLPEDWREPLQELGMRYADAARRKPSIADTVREALRRSLISEGLLDDRRKGAGNDTGRDL